MTEDKIPPDMDIQHEDPAVFYCWKYWMPNGEFREGCTPIAPNEGWPDLNDYGYIYILVPLAALFILIFFTFCICSKTEKKKAAQSNVNHKSLLIEDSMTESDDDMEMPVRAPMRYSSPGHTVQAVPVRMSNSKNDFYHSVQMVRHGQANKIPLEGGVVPMTAQQQYQKQAERDRKIYPRLSRMINSGNSTTAEVNTNGKIVQPKTRNKPASTIASGNNYVNSLASENQGKKTKQGHVNKNEVVEESETEGEYTEEETESEEENTRK